SRTPARRAAAVLLLALAAPVVLAGCAGDDLAKVTFERTTVPPQPGSGGTGPVPEGEIDAPALGADKLRTVDTCELLRGEAVSQLGTVGEPLGTSPETCAVSVTDRGDKELRVALSLGERLYAGRDQATGGLDGLPLIESRDDKSCTDKVLTEEDPDAGISLQVTYDDGEPCGASRKVLSKILQRLKSDPPQIEADDGSLLLVDPCTVLPESQVRDLLGSNTVTSPYLLHGCTITGASAGTSGSVSVAFSFNYPPLESANASKVELSSSVTAIQSYYNPETEVCQVEWEHKEFSKPSSRDGEVVKVDYSSYTGDGKATDACKKAVRLAKAVVRELPGA
ncbi:MAG: DUF3558 family protein, partial [Thermocrispum sp.]